MVELWYINQIHLRARRNNNMLYFPRGVGSQSHFGKNNAFIKNEVILYAKE